MPGPHGVQEVAPSADPVSVSDPGLQTLQEPAPPVEYCPAAHCSHAAAAEEDEYVPGPHGVQEVAPSADPVSVSDPSGQSSHVPASSVCEYCPAAHCWHPEPQLPTYVPGWHGIAGASGSVSCTTPPPNAQHISSEVKSSSS